MSNQQEAEVSEPDDPDVLVRHRKEDTETDVGEAQVDGAMAEEAM